MTRARHFGYAPPVSVVLAACRANELERRTLMADAGTVAEVTLAEVEVTADMEAELSEMGKGEER